MLEDVPVNSLSGLTHTSEARSTARPALRYLFFTLCASLYLLPFMRVLFLGTDEGLLISGAVRVANGQVFARDFSEIVGPGTFYWLAIFFKLFGVTFMAAHICLFLTSLGNWIIDVFPFTSGVQEIPGTLMCHPGRDFLWYDVADH